MKQEVKAGQTDYTVLVFIPDSASTDGSGKTGLAHSDMTVSYTRVETDNDVTTSGAVSMANLASLTAAHSDWGWEEVDSTNAPGLYRLDIADAVFATGAWSAVVYVMVTTSAAAATPMEFILVPVDPYTGVNAQTVAGSSVSVAASAVDANVTKINGADVGGDGSAGDPWGPA